MVAPVQEIVIHQELPKLVRHEVEEILAWTIHQILADLVLGCRHADTGAASVQLDENHSEILFLAKRVNRARERDYDENNLKFVPPRSSARYWPASLPVGS